MTNAKTACCGRGSPIRRRFDGWGRYECALNTVWRDIPVWSRCLYDTATAPAVVLDAAERTHPRIVSPSGDCRPSGRYQDVSEFHGLASAPDLLEQAAPAIELADSSAAASRHALSRADPLAGLIPPVGGALSPGLGLWLAHQLDIDVALIQSNGGFTVRLRAGTNTG